MPSVKEMAEAHLGNVQKAILDLEQQKANIDDEIKKLESYLQQGVATLNPEEEGNENDK
jgi:hypothetical protein